MFELVEKLHKVASPEAVSIAGHLLENFRRRQIEGLSLKLRDEKMTIFLLTQQLREHSLVRDYLLLTTHKERLTQLKMSKREETRRTVSLRGQAFRVLTRHGLMDVVPCPRQQKSSIVEALPSSSPKVKVPARKPRVETLIPATPGVSLAPPLPPFETFAQSVTGCALTIEDPTVPPGGSAQPPWVSTRMLPDGTEVYFINLDPQGS